MRRLTTREEETGQESTREDTERMRTGRRGAADTSRSLGAQEAGGDGLASAERGMGTDKEMNMTGATARTRRKARKTKGHMTYMQQVKPVFERLLGQLELALLGGVEEVADIRTEREWRTVECPAMVRMPVNKQKGFARFVLEAASHEEAVGSLMTL
jgi:hypothetical protein